MSCHWNQIYGCRDSAESEYLLSVAWKLLVRASMPLQPLTWVNWQRLVPHTLPRQNLQGPHRSPKQRTTTLTNPQHFHRFDFSGTPKLTEHRLAKDQAKSLCHLTPKNFKTAIALYGCVPWCVHNTSFATSLTQPFAHFLEFVPSF